MVAALGELDILRQTAKDSPWNLLAVLRIRRVAFPPVLVDRVGHRRPGDVRVRRSPETGYRS